MSLSETDEVFKAATTVLNRILQLPNERRQQRYVRECQKAMEYVLVRIEERLAPRDSTTQ